MLLKKSSCVFLPALFLPASLSLRRLSCICYHCVGMYPVYIYICIFLHESADDNATLLFIYFDCSQLVLSFGQCQEKMFRGENLFLKVLKRADML